jgi:hypothetical protein
MIAGTAILFIAVPVILGHVWRQRDDEDIAGSTEVAADQIELITFGEWCPST